MIEKVIDGIVAKLNEVFGDSYEIYTESVEQGLEEPCFSIVCLNPKQIKLIGNRYDSRNVFVIHYFPEHSDSMNADMRSVIEQLYDNMEFITLDDGDMLMGKDMDAEIVDNVVSFTVNYNFTIYKQREEKPTMDSYGLSTGVKG